MANQFELNVIFSVITLLLSPTIYNLICLQGSVCPRLGDMRGHRGRVQPAGLDAGQPLSLSKEQGRPDPKPIQYITALVFVLYQLDHTFLKLHSCRIRTIKMSPTVFYSTNLRT